MPIPLRTMFESINTFSDKDIESISADILESNAADTYVKAELYKLREYEILYDKDTLPDDISSKLMKDIFSFIEDYRYWNRVLKYYERYMALYSKLDKEINGKAEEFNGEEKSRIITYIEKRKNLIHKVTLILVRYKMLLSITHELVASSYSQFAYDIYGLSLRSHEPNCVDMDALARTVLDSYTRENNIDVKHNAGLLKVLKSNLPDLDRKLAYYLKYQGLTYASAEIDQLKDSIFLLNKAITKLSYIIYCLEKISPSNLIDLGKYKSILKRDL